MKTDFEVDVPGSRLDVYLAARIAGESRSKLQTMIRNGLVQVNGSVVTKPAYELSSGDSIQIEIREEGLSEVGSDPPEIDILYEENDFIVLNKSPGMVVHPSYGHESGTLSNGVLAYAPDLEAVGREGLVHRLDKDTSGLIIFAKNPASLKRLQGLFKTREVEKTYLALVDGIPPSHQGRVEAPIGRDPRNRQQFAVQQSAGRQAVTEFIVRERFDRHALLEARPITGRTHQIRIHLSFIGCPIVGDKVYGRKVPSLKVERQMLHAWKLKLPGRDEFEAPVPGDFEQGVKLARSG